MMIARHNYEEYFLMYVDNELTAEERASVELFARQNPDLAAELDILLETKLTADDTLVFANKKDLLQNANTVSIDNYEEQFLLYIDNELGLEQKESVEKFVLQHPQFQDEFTLLKQTVLEPEVAVFKDKAGLLRKEERRVVPMFLRFAAAAALTGIAVLVWWMQSNNNTTTLPGTIAVQKNDSGKGDVASGDKKDKATPLPETIVTPQQQDLNTGEITASVKQPVLKNRNEKVLTGQKNVVKEDVVVVPVITKSDNSVAAYKPTAPNDNDVVKDMPSGAEINTYTSITKEKTDQEYIDEALLRYAKTTDASNSKYAKNALYKELNTEEEESNSLYLGSMQINKNKVRGFMKKVGGLFAGKSKDGLANEDGKLQVANLELNTN